MAKFNLENYDIKRNEDGRIIKEVINLGEGDIEILEATEEIENEILGYIQENSIAEFSDIETIKFLIPLLTNIEFGNLSEDRIYKLIENPPMWLKSVNNHVEILVNEIYKNYMLSLKRQTKDVERLLEMNEVMNNLPIDKLNKLKELNNRDDAEKIKQIMEFTDGIVDDLPEEEQEKINAAKLKFEEEMTRRKEEIEKQHKKDALLKKQEEINRQLIDLD